VTTLTTSHVSAEVGYEKQGAQTLSTSHVSAEVGYEHCANQVLTVLQVFVEIGYYPRPKIIVPLECNGALEVSTDGSTWTDISGYSCAVEWDGFERHVGEAQPYDDDAPVVAVGKRQPGTMTVRVAYTEGAADVFKTAWDAWQNNSQLQLRYWPGGGDASDQGLYTDTDSRVIAPPRVQGAAHEGDPITVTFSVVTGRLQLATHT